MKVSTNSFLYRNTVTLEDVIDAATDIGLWGHLIITAVGLTPTSPLGTCKPLYIFQRSSLHLISLLRLAHCYQIIQIRRRKYSFYDLSGST